MYFAFRTVVLRLCVLFLFGVCLVRTDYASASFQYAKCLPLRCSSVKFAGDLPGIGHGGSGQAVSQLHSECARPQIWSHNMLEKDEAVHYRMLNQSPQNTFVRFEYASATIIVNHQQVRNVHATHILVIGHYLRVHNGFCASSLCSPGYTFRFVALYCRKKVDVTFVLPFSCCKTAVM